MTLYLKYRPKKLEELDLTEVRDTLKKIIISGSIPHAFLFSGPKGLGKTSAARILAKIVNCENPTKDGEPCNKCSQCKAINNGSHLDIIEIDAASHRGIDDIRALREVVKLAPTMGKKKVYIVDEAHMLTLEASNALLKTLEEPPDHVMFILATTNPEKLIDTIRSRATNVLFKKPSNDEIMRSLSRVIKGENIKMGEEDLVKIIELSQSSFRDAVKILETTVITGSLDIVTGIPVDELISDLVKKDDKSAIGKICEMTQVGVPMELLEQRLISRLHLALLACVGIGEGKIEELDKDELVDLITIISQTTSSLKSVTPEELPLQIAIVKWCANAEEVPQEKQEKKEIITDMKVPVNSKSTDAAVDPMLWSKVLNLAKGKNKSVEALLRSSKPLSFNGDTLVLGVYYSFHKERLEAQPHRQILDNIIREVVGRNVRIVCTLTSPEKKDVEVIKKEEGVVLAEIPSDATALTKDESGDIIKLAKEMFGS